MGIDLNKGQDFINLGGQNADVLFTPIAGRHGYSYRPEDSIGIDPSEFISPKLGLYLY
jgi:hypothetical protein